MSIPDFVIENIRKEIWWQLHCHCPLSDRLHVATVAKYVPLFHKG